MMPNLQRLNLSFCFNLEKFEVHGGCLKSLVYLNLIGCPNLKSFLFIEDLESLEVLYLRRWLLLDKPKHYIIRGQSNNRLLELHLFGLDDTKEVHPSIGSLHNLVSLCFSNCLRLEIHRGRIVGLMPQSKDFSNAFVKYLFISFFKLKNLKTLILHQCGLPHRSYSDICRIESSEKLDLIGYHNFRDMPSSICELKHLKDMNFIGCMRLDKLPDDLEGLKVHRSDVKYQVSEYDDFIRLCFTREPQTQEFQKLKILDLRRCDIEEVPESLGHLELLEELRLTNTDVKHLPDSICMLKHLKYLILQRCVLLKKLPDNLGELESLQTLDLSRCYSIREIPSSICMLKQLKILDLWHCFCLEKLPEGIGQLESLEELYITGCYNIRQIPDSICLLKNLKKLELEGCGLQEA
ncbi:hypothetical protein R6Q59_002293 [Mikania micrantha]